MSMTDHPESHSAAVAHGTSIAPDDPRLPLAAALKFEPSELHDFELADKAAGQMMGKLLAFLFCVLFFLMTGVNVWMRTHADHGTDPQAIGGVPAVTEHH
jgi:hypothetical protein